MERGPALVLVDIDLSDDVVLPMMKLLRIESEKSRCVVLTNNRVQQRDALTAGADAAVLKGYPAADLFEMIEMLAFDSE